MLDEEKMRREFGRWVLLLTLYNGEPYGAWEEPLLSTLQGMYADATKNETRRQLEYLRERGLANIDKHFDGRWHCKLTRTGIDVMEYTVECDAGIARPPKD